MDEQNRYWASRPDESCPFIYLTTALRRHSFRRYYLNRILLNASENKGRGAVSFALFLACLIQDKQVLLFDVNNLTVVNSEETAEVVEALKFDENSLFPEKIGIAFGRDYCLDRSRLSEALKESKHIDYAKDGFPTAKGSSMPPNVSIFSGQKVDFWGRKKDIRSLEFLDLKRAEGRYKATLPPSKSPGRIALASIAQSNLKPSGLLPPAEDCPHRFDPDGEEILLIGKINRQGEPALFLGNEKEIDEGNTPLHAVPLEKTEKESAYKKYAKWQARINQIAEESGHRGKTHVQLCNTLAEEIKTSFSKDGKDVTSETIRRYTKAPGNRKPGGKRYKTI